jgi:tetratricopeptide (TPR) repeat protein
MRLGAFLSSAFLLLLADSSAASAADWVRVETPNFVVYGESGEARVREVADEFERFREALARVIPSAATPAAVPTVVVVFASQRSFDPYVPRVNGKPITLGGYFYATEDLNLVALADGNRDESLRTIFHEYVHLVLDNVARGMPLWLNEGLAEYYSTFQVDDGGRRALIGKVIPSHIQLLNTRRLMTIPELLAVDRDSPTYTEGQQQSLFYAQSWALVHLLVSGSANRASQLVTYARLVSEGAPSPDAWQQVFSDQNLGRELQRYLGQDVMTGVLYRFPDRIARTKSAAVTVGAGDVQAVLGDLLRRVAPVQEAAAQFDKAISVQPPSSRARALYALLLIENNDTARAKQLLLEAARDAGDWLVQYHVATGLTRLVTGSDTAEPELLSVARSALERVRAARPDLPNAHALEARLETAEDRNPLRALEEIRRARSLSPGRDDYVLLESFILMRLGQFAAARTLVSPLTGPRTSNAVRSNARDVLAQIELFEQQAADYLARLEGRQPAGGGVPARAVPALRKLQPDEQRFEGVLERIDCSDKGVVFEVTANAMAERFAAASLASVSLISHRDDMRGTISCGRRMAPEHVYVTWKPPQNSGAMRIAIAVEFLPRN